MRIETVNGALHQWDTGRQVQITLDEGVTLREVRFSHHHMPSPTRVAPEADGVINIPDEILRFSGTLWVSAVMADADGKPFTRSECFCIECHVRPEDYSAGGGSGGSGKMFTITRFEDFTAGGDTQLSANFTFAELMDAIANGTFCGAQRLWVAYDFDMDDSGDIIPGSRKLGMVSYCPLTNVDLVTAGTYAQIPETVFLMYDYAGDAYCMREDDSITFSEYEM